MKKWIVAVVAVVAACFSTFAIAGNVVPSEAPAWVYQVIGVFAGLVSVVAQVDAQISESFKAKWPWWLRLVWDLIAGNYRHSKNVGGA